MHPHPTPPIHGIRHHMHLGTTLHSAVIPCIDAYHFLTIYPNDLLLTTEEDLGSSPLPNLESIPPSPSPSMAVVLKRPGSIPLSMQTPSQKANTLNAQRKLIYRRPRYMWHTPKAPRSKPSGNSQTATHRAQHYPKHRCVPLSTAPTGGLGWARTSGRRPSMSHRGRRCTRSRGGPPRAAAP